MQNTALPSASTPAASGDPKQDLRFYQTPTFKAVVGFVIISIFVLAAAGVAVTQWGPTGPQGPAHVATQEVHGPLEALLSRPVVSNQPPLGNFKKSQGLAGARHFWERYKTAIVAISVVGVILVAVGVGLAVYFVEQERMLAADAEAEAELERQRQQQQQEEFAQDAVESEWNYVYKVMGGLFVTNLVLSLTFFYMSGLRASKCIHIAANVIFLIIEITFLQIVIGVVGLAVLLVLALLLLLALSLLPELLSAPIAILLLVSTILFVIPYAILLLPVVIFKMCFKQNRDEVFQMIQRVKTGFPPQIEKFVNGDFENPMEIFTTLKSILFPQPTKA